MIFKTKNLNLKRNLLILTIFIVFVSFGVARTRSRMGSHQSQAANSLSVGSPRASHTFIAYPRPTHRFRELSDLVNQSSEILVGVPIAKTSHQSAGPNSMILTDYDIKVLETIKGDRHRGRTVTLQLPGGSVVLPDGTLAQTDMPQFWQSPTLARAYVFFVKKKKAAPSELIGGPQGLFAISPWPDNFSVANAPDFATGRQINPQAQDSDELMTKFNGKSVAFFLGEIKRLAGNGLFAPRPKPVNRR